MRLRGVLCVALLLLAGPALAEGGLLPEDPMVKISALKMNLDIDEVLAGISADVAKATGVEEKYITYYWTTFDGVVWDGKRQVNRPVFVDFHPPGFFTKEVCITFMHAFAEAIERHTGVDREWVFIATHFPRQDLIYISGGIQHIDEYTKAGFELATKKQEDPMLDEFRLKNPAYLFQLLWRLGVTANGGGDIGEMLTTTSKIKDDDDEGWYKAWTDQAGHVAGLAREYLQAGHEISAQAAFFRATTYYRAAEVYLPHDDPRVVATWQQGRDTFLEAAKLSAGLIKYVEIPFEETTLPAYYLRVDDSRKKRPLLIVQTGLDGSAEDLYFILGPQALKRGYNCLIFEGPGQGEMIRKKNLPFRHNWETVVTPVVDYALKLREVDRKRVALVAYSMGGYRPRALAHEPRIPFGVVDGGVYSVWEGTATKFPEEVLTAVGDASKRDRVNELVNAEMAENADIDQFIKQMLWTFGKNDAYDLLVELKTYDIGDSVDKITAEMLVLASVHDQVAGSYEQSKKLYNALPGKKTYSEFTTAEGGQFHCQSGAPSVSAERILNWLDDRLKP